MDAPGRGIDERPTTTPRARPKLRGDRRFWLAVGAFTVLAVALRVAYTAQYLWHAPLGDDASFYYFQSKVLAGGHWFVQPFDFISSGGRTSVPVATHPPLFTLLLAGFRILGVDTQHRVQLLCTAIGGFTVVPMALLGREVGGRRVGMLAGALTAVYAPRAFADGTGFAEVVYIPLLALLFLFAYRLLRKPSIASTVAFGLLGGLATMTRGEALLVVVVVGVLVVAAAPLAGRRRAGTLAVLLAGTAVVILPWFAYNLTRFEHPVPVSTNGGATLAGANCDGTYHGPYLGLWSFGCSLPTGVTITPAGTLSTPKLGDDSQVDQELRSRGLHYAREHLGRVPVVVAARVGRMFNLYRPVQTAELDVGLGKGRRAWVDAGIGEAALLGALAGAWVTGRRSRRELLPWAGATASVVVIAAGFYGYFRFRGPVDVTFLVLSAVALDALWTRVDRRRAHDGPGRGVAPEVPADVGAPA